jgi:hypothetical protein
LAPLLDALAPQARATRIERGKHEGLWTVYQLIDRGSSDRYRRTVESAFGDDRRFTVRISGPAPCYAFAGLI